MERGKQTPVESSGRPCGTDRWTRGSRVVYRYFPHWQAGFADFARDSASAGLARAWPREQATVALKIAAWGTLEPGWRISEPVLPRLRWRRPLPCRRSSLATRKWLAREY